MSKYVANGTFGCVLKPYIPCSKDKLDKEPIGDTISKVFGYTDEADAEYQKHKNIVNMIDPNNTFTVPLYGKCVVTKHDTPQEEISKCGNVYIEYLSQMQEYAQLVYADGGIMITDCIYSGVPFDDIIAGMHSVFKGLVSMGAKKMCHGDIKPANMVYNHADKKVRLIDFGMMLPFKTLFDSEESPWGSQYMYHPPETNILGLWDTGKKEMYRNWRFLISSQSNLEELNKYIKCVASSRTASIVAAIFEYDKHSDDFDKFTKKINHKNFNPSQLQPYAKYFDCYSVGISLLQTVVDYMTVIEDDSEKFKKSNVSLLAALLLLIQKMIAVEPTDRYTPQKALAHFEKHVLRFVNNPQPLKENHELYYIFAFDNDTDEDEKYVDYVTEYDSIYKQTVKPHISCKFGKLDKKPVGSTFATIINNNKLATKLYKEYKDIVLKNDPQHTFILPMYGKCTAKKNRDVDESIFKCMAATQLVFSDNGHEPGNLEIGFTDLIAGHYQIFKGLVTMSKAGYCLMNVTSSNMRYEVDEKKLRLIAPLQVYPFTSLYDNIDDAMLKDVKYYHPAELDIVKMDKTKIIQPKAETFEKLVEHQIFYYLNGDQRRDTDMKKLVEKIFVDKVGRANEFNKLVREFNPVKKNFEISSLNKYSHYYDVYSLGSCIMYVLSIYHNFEMIEEKDSELVLAVLKMARCMTSLYPPDRFTAEQALAHYEEHVLPLTRKQQVGSGSKFAKLVI
jgi:serine/threonine protein kinase